MSIDIKAITDAFTTKVNNVDFVNATDINSLQAGLRILAESTISQTGYYNSESLSATKFLTDDDLVYQLYNVNAGTQIVHLPATANENHPFVIMNTGNSTTTYVTVKDINNNTILELGAGDYAIFLSMFSTWKYLKTGFDPYFNIQVVIGDGISPITTGIKGDLEVPYNCEVVGWTMYEGTGTTGSIVVDVWKDVWGNFPPTVGDTITGTEKPNIASAVKGYDVALTTWTTSLNKGQILRFNVDSASSVKQVTLCLKCRRV